MTEDCFFEDGAIYPSTCRRCALKITNSPYGGSVRIDKLKGNKTMSWYAIQN